MLFKTVGAMGVALVGLVPVYAVAKLYLHKNGIHPHAEKGVLGTFVEKAPASWRWPAALVGFTVCGLATYALYRWANQH